MSGALLEVEHLTVAFGGLTAVNDLSFTVEEGSVSALIGPNGAGKTTTFNALNGSGPMSKGTVVFDGQDVTGLDSRGRSRLGVARTFQNLSLVDALPVGDNVAVGAARFRRTGLFGAMLRTPRVRREDRLVGEIVDRALEFVGIGGVRHLAAGSLPYGDRRRLEIARALAAGPRLLLLDEPSAGMDASETEDLASLVLRARDAFDLTVLVIEHDMDFVRQVATRTTVLDFGQLIASGPTDAVLRDPKVIEVYLGTAGSEPGPREVIHA
jgi:ABC-type branched-subunit amino acid transport system ATPase component